MYSLKTSLLQYYFIISASFCSSRAPYISAMASMPEPDITAQLVQLVTASKGLPSSAPPSSSQGYWPPTAGGYADPQYAYSYAPQYGYPQPVSMVCIIVMYVEGEGERLRERERERERERLLYFSHPPHTPCTHTQPMPPSGYMFSPGAYQTSATTPTFMEDLEDPNPLIDPETVNREFYQLDKVRETVYNLIASIGCPNHNTHHDCAYTFTYYSCRCYLHNLMMLDGVILSLNQRSCDRPCIHQPMAHPPHNVASLALPTLINHCTIEL